MKVKEKKQTCSQRSDGSRRHIVKGRRFQDRRSKDMGSDKNRIKYHTDMPTCLYLED